MSEPRHLINRAFHLYRLVSKGHVDPYISELVELGEQLVELLPQLDDDLLFAQGAIALVHPLRLTGRISELPVYMREVISRVDGEELATMARFYLAQYLTMFRDLSASMAVLDEVDPGALSVEMAARYRCLRAANLVDMGQVDEAMAWLDAAEREVMDTGLHVARQRILAERGIVSVRQGHYRDAILDLERASALAMAHMQSEQVVTSVEINLSVALLGDRQYAQAEALFARCLDEACERGDARATYVPRVNLVLTLMVQGKWEQAARNLARVERRGGHGLSTPQVLEAILAAAMPPHDVSALEAAARASHDDTFLGNRAVAMLWLHAHDPDAYPAFPKFESNEFVHSQTWRYLAGESARPEFELNAIEAHLATKLGVEPSAISPLRISVNYDAFSVHGEAWCSLSRRHTARKLFACLCKAWPDPISAWDLYEQVWPARQISAPDDLSILYTAMHRLRALGLQEVIGVHEEGYILEVEPVVDEHV